MSGPDGGELTGCRECGAVQVLPPPDGRSRFTCVNCRSLLEQTKGRSQTAALALATSTFLLLIPANFEPFLTTSALGVSRTSHLVSSAWAMEQDGWPLLAAFVFLFVVALPFVRFGLLSVVLGALKLGRRPPWLGRAFRYANALQTWAMPDVFLLALAVAYARMRMAIATHAEVGFVLFVLAALAAMFTRALLDKGAVWREIGPDPAPCAGPVVTCTACEYLAPANLAGHPCPRCASPLHRRKPESVSRTSALTLAALLFYLPANLLALATLPIGFTSTKYTVFQGVVDLAQAHLWDLAVLVFVASFAIPFLKLVVMGLCVSSVLVHSGRWLKTKTRLYQIVEEVGRWSMVDPFVIGIFVPVMHYNSFIYARAEPAATPFALVVVLTVLGSHLFDPRLMWDAARGRAPTRAFPLPARRLKDLDSRA